MSKSMEMTHLFFNALKASLILNIESTPLMPWQVRFLIYEEAG